MTVKFFWLVDAVIIYALLTAHNESEKDYERSILNIWLGILQDAVDLDDKLRARIYCHVTEIGFEDTLETMHWKYLPFIYLQSVLAHSQEGYFNEKEKEIAYLLLLKNRKFVEPYFSKADIMPLAEWRFTLAKIRGDFMSNIKAVDLSYDKTMAAVAQGAGMISVISLPRLVKLWDCSTHYGKISCCTFAPHDSFALFGKLEAVLNIAERKEVPFFHGIKETFQSCAFSPKGNRLVTCDGSDTVKLWDVAKQSLLSSLCADCSVIWCSFSNTGLFIIGDNGLNGRGVFCIWNAITQQRSDERNVFNMPLNDKNVFHSKRCHCYFKPGLKDVTHYYSRKLYTALKPAFRKRL